jgi:hypothetical protein
MTVNTNGNAPAVAVAGVNITSLDKKLTEIRDSQLRTEKMVTEFIESMAKNPMLGAMAKMMGGRK